MTYLLWYRTYTDEVAPMVDSPTYEEYTNAETARDLCVVQESQRPDQYIKTIDIQHVQCGEMVAYCECEDI
jgi:hypothetical protein